MRLTTTWWELLPLCVTLWVTLGGRCCASPFWGRSGGAYRNGQAFRQLFCTADVLNGSAEELLMHCEML